MKKIKECFGFSALANRREEEGLRPWAGSADSTAAGQRSSGQAGRAQTRGVGGEAHGISKGVITAFELKPEAVREKEEGFGEKETKRTKALTRIYDLIRRASLQDNMQFRKVVPGLEPGAKTGDVIS